METRKKKSTKLLKWSLLKKVKEERKWGTLNPSLYAHALHWVAYRAHIGTGRGRLTCSHECVDLLWAAFRALHAVIFLQQLIHLGQVNSWVR